MHDAAQRLFDVRAHGPSHAATPEVLRQEARFSLAKFVLADVPLPDLVREIAETISSVLGADFAFVMRYLPDEGALLLESSVGFEPGLDGHMRVPAGHAARLGYVSQASYTMSCDHPVVVDDLENEPRLEGCELIKMHGATSGVTVRVADDEVPANVPVPAPYGLIGAHWRTPRRIAPQEKDWMEDIAGVLAGAHKRRLAILPSAEEALAVERRRYDGLRGAISLLGAAAGPRGALEAAASTLIARGADWAFVDLLEDDSEPGYTTGDSISRVVVRRATNPTAEPAGPTGAQASAETEAGVTNLAHGLAHNYPLDPGAPIGTPKVLRSRRPHLHRRITAEDIQRVSTGPDHEALIARVSPTSCAAAPIWSRGRVAGALVALSTHGRTLDEEFLASVEEIADCATLTLSNSVAGLSMDEEREKIAGLARPPADVASASKDEAGRQRTLPPRLITPSQQVVLELRAECLSQKEIARKLGVSVDCVKQHVRGACKRLGVSGGWRPAFDEALRLGEVRHP